MAAYLCLAISTGAVIGHEVACAIVGIAMTFNVDVAHFLLSWD